MDKDYKELIEYLDKKFSGVDKKFSGVDGKLIDLDGKIEELKENKADKSDINELLIGERKSMRGGNQPPRQITICKEELLALKELFAAV